MLLYEMASILTQPELFNNILLTKDLLETVKGPLKC